MMLQAVMETRDYKIPSDWQNRGVKTILTVGKYLSMQKDKLSSEEFKKLIAIDLKLKRDSAYKLISIANHSIISDPAYENRLPPSWALLYELRSVESIVLETKLAAGQSFRDFTKYDIWEMCGRTKKKYPNYRQQKSSEGERKILSGARLTPNPPGKTLVNWIKEGITLEDRGIRREEVPGKIGMGYLSYRTLRNIIKTLEMDISNEERRAIERALKDIEQTRLVMVNYYKVKPIIDRIRGGKKRLIGKSVDRKIKDKFFHALQIMEDTCGIKLVIPYMSSLELLEAERILERAKTGLQRLSIDLVRTLRETIKQENTNE